MCQEKPLKNLNQGNKLSQRRDVLMGMAIFLIIIFHSSINVASADAAGFIKRICDAEVDIFWLLVTVWYAIINFVTKDFGIIAYIEDITILSYWLKGTMSAWFVAEIAVFYIISPFLFRQI